MRAIWQYELGEPGVLEYEEVRDPVPGEGQVRIEVYAAGVHLIDTAIRRGIAPPFAQATLPMTPGREVAGIVDSIGAGVDPAWIGRRVVAHLGLASGGYAELAVAPVDALHMIPAGLSDEAAVAMIGTGRTLLSVLDVAAPTSSDIVVITAAVGGIGSLLIQTANAVDALVVGLTGGADKMEVARQFGADIAIDYLGDDWESEVIEALDGRQPTLVYDGVGGEIGDGLARILDPSGHRIVFGAAGGIFATAGAPAGSGGGRGTGARGSAESDAAAVAARTTYAVGPNAPAPVHTQRELETAAIRAAADGELTPRIHEPFALANASGAHAALEARETMGKVILHP